MCIDHVVSILETIRRMCTGGQGRVLEWGFQSLCCSTDRRCSLEGPPFSDVFQMNPTVEVNMVWCSQSCSDWSSERSGGKGVGPEGPLRPIRMSLCFLCLPGDKRKSPVKSCVTPLRLEHETLRVRNPFALYSGYILQVSKCCVVVFRISNDTCEILFHKMWSGNERPVNVGYPSFFKILINPSTQTSMFWNR